MTRTLPSEPAAVPSLTCAIFATMHPATLQFAVEASGVHEALIGLGMAVGPISGIAGIWLGPHLPSMMWGTLIGMAPMFLLSLAAAGWRLRGVGARRIGGPG